MADRILMRLASFLGAFAAYLEVYFFPTRLLRYTALCVLAAMVAMFFGMEGGVRVFSIMAITFSFSEIIINELVKRLRDDD